MSISTPDKIFDQNGRLLGIVTSMTMSHSFSSGGASRVEGTFELTDGMAFLRTETKEKTMNEDSSRPSGCEPMISPQLERAVQCNPEAVIEDLEALLETARESLKREERYARKRKKEAKRQRRAVAEQARRREQALTVLEEGTRKPLSEVRIKAASALLDRLG